MPAPNGEFNFDDAPGGEFSLDDIFASTAPNTPVTQTTPEPDNVEAQPLLKTSTGTVYKTVDDAVAGIEHKDALIAQLRQQVQEATKVDPLKKKAEVVEDGGQVSYIANPKKYFEDIKAAKDEAELLKVQGQFVDERLAPYAPLMASLAKSQALEGLEHEVPKIREFLRSDDYQKTLEAFPLLKQSIEISEMYPERSVDLPQLYRMAADLATGRTLPKVTQGNVSNVPQVVRPTVSSTPAVPPPTVVVAPPSLSNSDGRKSIIQQQEQAGVENLRF